MVSPRAEASIKIKVSGVGQSCSVHMIHTQTEPEEKSGSVSGSFLAGPR